MERQYWLSAAIVLAGWATACSGGRVHAPSHRWHSTIQRDHPLSGTVYDVSAGRSVSRADLDRALGQADVVLIGERHDNVDHHVLQTQMLRAILAGGRRPAVVFEQLDIEDQEAIDATLAAHRDAPSAERAAAIAEAVSWKTSGWPPFEDYQPIFQTGLAAGLPIRAANLSREKLRAGPGGDDSAPESFVALSAEGRAALEADIVDSHCGYASAPMVEAMVKAQRRRDDAIAKSVADALQGAGRISAGRERVRAAAVVICGFGHARDDYGVPVSLGTLLPAHRVLSVGLLEVIADEMAPGDYVAALNTGRLPFDYVLFTPRASDEDPCEKFRAGLENMKLRSGSSVSP